MTEKLEPLYPFGDTPIGIVKNPRGGIVAKVSPGENCAEYTNLFSAAPDLLEAVIALRARLVSNWGTELPDEIALSIADAAIAKANRQ